MSVGEIGRREGGNKMSQIGSFRGGKERLSFVPRQKLIKLTKFKMFSFLFKNMLIYWRLVRIPILKGTFPEMFSHLSYLSHRTADNCRASIDTISFEKILEGRFKSAHQEQNLYIIIRRDFLIIFYFLRR